MSGESRFRNKITWFSFLFSVLVVWVHSVNAKLFLEESPYVEAVTSFQRFLGNTVAQIAVPGFFMMSGYLFYRDFGWEKLGAKWRRRIRTLVVPFLLWNAIYYLGYVAGSRIPVVMDIAGKGKVPLDWRTAVDAVLHYAYNYVFWYLYQLIVLTVLAPAFYGIFQCAFGAMAAMAVLFYFVQRGTTIPCLNLDALFYYGLGGFGGIYGRKIVEGQWSVGRCMAGAGMLMLAIALLVSGRSGVTAGKVCYRALTPVGLWFMADEKRLGPAKEWMQYNFFLYASHFAMVRLVNKTAARILGGCWLVPVALFTAMPALMVWLGGAAGSWMKREMPVVWALLNGGR